MSKNKEETILAASIGNCIHAVTLYKFLNFLSSDGYSTIFIGSAIPIPKLIKEVLDKKPDRIVVSYRLTAEVAKTIFKNLKQEIEKNGLDNIPIILSGTPSVIEVGKSIGIFDFTFSDIEPELVRNYLQRNCEGNSDDGCHSQYLPEFIEIKSPIPLIRHHFGQPSLEETIRGAKEIAESGVLDILSIGTDQNSQEFFFRQKEMDDTLKGSGGVPIRKEDDLIRIYSATRCGNYPLVRCYSGTQDLIKWGKMLKSTINIAWGAVPLTWYCELDGRSKRSLKEAIAENQQAIRWYANNNIPVEVNESHQWGLRFTSDVIEVVCGFIAAYNAKKLGVKHFVMQYMMNTPSGISPEMDLAKMLAKIELVESLHSIEFTSYRMIRTGLASMSKDMNVAKGQLASSVTIGMALKPHIIHVVGYTEGDHAAKASEVIESCKIIKGVVGNCLLGLPDLSNNERIIHRKDFLLKEANILLDSIKKIDPSIREPLISPDVLSKAIKIGLLDAPLLKGLTCANGELITKIINGCNCSVIPDTGEVIGEQERTEMLLRKYENIQKKRTRLKE